jgi:hypothetical protein
MEMKSLVGANAALQIPNIIQSLSCYAWMKSYLKLIGDFQPNKDEIHLEPISVIEIYNEYVTFIETKKHEYLSRFFFGKS